MLEDNRQKRGKGGVRGRECERFQRGEKIRVGTRAPPSLKMNVPGERAQMMILKPCVRAKLHFKE